MRLSFRLFRQTILLTFLLPAKLAFSQSYDFRVFDSNTGLPQNFVYCLAQDHEGFIWIGTGEGLVKYDGLKFKNFTSTDSLAGDFVRDIFVAENGDVWVGHDNGSLSKHKKNVFSKIVVPSGSSPIRDICEDDQGVIWAVEQNSGIVSIDKNGKLYELFNREKFGRKLYYSINSIDKQNLLVGTSEGLLKVKIGKDGLAEEVNLIGSVPETGINAIVKRRDNPWEFWIATEDKGFYLYKWTNDDSQGFTTNKLCLDFNIQNENITDIVEDDENNLLVSTWENGVIKLLYDPMSGTYNQSLNFSETNGLNKNNIKDILHDREGNYWFATYGGGVSTLVNDHFIYYQLADIGFKNNKVSSVLHFDNELWMGLENGMLKADPYCFTAHEFYDKYQGIPADVVTDFLVDQDHTLWIATSQNGLYKRKKGDVKFSRHPFTSNLLGNQINDIEWVEGKIYIATLGGLYILDTNNSNKLTHLTTEQNLPHNSINFIYKDTGNAIWIGPKSSGICKIDIDQLNIEVHRLDQSPVDVSDMAQDQEGKYWLATKGKGLIQYTEDSIRTISVQNGLAKNFCHSLECDSHNRLWVAHHTGVSCVDLNTMMIRTFSHENRMGGDFQQIWKDTDNTLWFASSEGVLQYFPDRDKPNQVPPTINFTNIEINKEKYQLDKAIELPFRYGKNYSYHFSFIGISFKNPKGVTYKYKLEEEGREQETEWVDLGANSFKDFEFLPSGNYTFKVVAYNADGIASPTPIEIKLRILPPFWKRLWFYLISILSIGYAIYRLIRYREDQLIKQKQVLQKEVASQTIILRKQKAEIERKNRDITDSINYAQRLQASILPPMKLLQQTFPESFIYFLPRDIVSGDFYWVHQHKDYLLVCIADCTGHGVPGAFMSIIGSTLLNDIAKAQPGLSPAEMLDNLDIELKYLLQKNADDHAPDGMDICIAEIHIPSYKIRVASAKRPVFLYTGNTLSVYKGTRRSIGDTVNPEDEGINFVNIEYQMEKGDSIYMFSDGYTDQFGGPLGKKFMKVGVTNLLEQIRHRNMAEQYEMVRTNFENWKGDLAQVDDVIFLGIQL